MTICTSSLIRTMTVGSGFAPDLLTLRARRKQLAATHAQALAGSPAGLSARPAYRRWGIAPRPEDALITG
ncbi:hypothetical protein PT2222_270023 [Paraburkholderia tropica]